MEKIDISIDHTAGVADTQLAEAVQQLKPEVERVAAAQKTGYESDYASINLPADAQMREQVKQVAAEHKKRKPTILVVIGIGGSNLGARAIHEALYGVQYNQHNPDLKVYYVDTVDTDAVYDIYLFVEQALEKGEEVLINVISKSGTTTETIANFELFYHLVKQYKKDAYNQSIVITTDKGSKLWEFGEQENITCLEIPKKVGGRFSVFSAVGLFPLCMIGVDIDALCAGAQLMVEQCLQVNKHNYAAYRAAVLAVQYKQGKTIHDTFVFSVDCESLGKWYRQLMGESIGKEHDRDGNTVHVGMTPTVSIGSTDLHSVGQLYLGGPRDTVTTFIAITKNKSNLVLPEYESFEKLVAKIQGKSVSFILHAILHGVQQAYANEGLPFMAITLPEKRAAFIGQLMQMQMQEIVYLGYLLNVNPFDQPHVELYKKETRKILAHE